MRAAEPTLLRTVYETIRTNHYQWPAEASVSHSYRQTATAPQTRSDRLPAVSPQILRRRNHFIVSRGLFGQQRFHR